MEAKEYKSPKQVENELLAENMKYKIALDKISKGVELSSIELIDIAKTALN